MGKVRKPRALVIDDCRAAECKAGGYILISPLMAGAVSGAEARIIAEWMTEAAAWVEQEARARKGGVRG